MEDGEDIPGRANGRRGRIREARQIGGDANERIHDRAVLLCTREQGVCFCGLSAVPLAV